MNRNYFTTKSIEALNLEPRDILDQYITVDQPVVIGLSGGPDSVFLMSLLTLFRTQKNYTDSNLVVCSLDHAVRLQSGDEIDYLRKLSTPYTFYTAKYTGPDTSERALRERRHQEFIRLCHSHNAKILLLGHNLTERAETFLLNLRRGANIGGMTSMSVYQSHRKDQSIHILRPLIHVAKTTILSHLDQTNTHYFTDHTNNDASVSQRNKLRKDVLPWLLTELDTETKFLQSLDDLFVFLEENKKEKDCEFIDHEPPSQRNVDRWKERKVDRTTLGHTDIESMLKKVGGAQGLTKQWLDELHHFLQHKKSGYKYKNGIYFFLTHDAIHVIKSSKKFRLLDDPSAHVLSESDIKGGKIKRQSLSLDLPDCACTGMIVRYGRSGDHVGSKNRSQYCINQKIPFFMRKNVPVLEKANHIQYVWKQGSNMVSF